MPASKCPRGLRLGPVKRKFPDGSSIMEWMDYNEGKCPPALASLRAALNSGRAL